MPQFVQFALDESLKGTSTILWVAGLGDPNTQDEINKISLKVGFFYKQEADLTKDYSFSFTVLLLLYYLHLLLVGT